MKNKYPLRTENHLLHAEHFLGIGKVIKFFLIIYLLIAGSHLQVNAQSANIDQVRNGPAASPVTPGAWVNGNVNASQAHMVEGYSVPYRMTVTGLTPGAHRLDIGFDSRVSSKHAIDYLTQYSRIEPHITQFGHPAEVIDPLIGTGLSTPSVITFPIPTPTVSKIVSGMPQPQTSFNALVAAKRVMTMFNGLAIDSITYLTEGSLTLPSSSTSIRIWFRTTNATVVFAWGGHIASQYDWGTGNSASSVSGSPYHMQLLGIDGSGGSQDRALQASAVSAPQCLIGGPTTVCSGLNVTYTGPTGAGYSYQWAIVNNNTGASIVGTNTGQNVSVNPGNTGGTYGLQITVSSGISVSTCNITITVNVPGNCSISPAASLCPGASQTYTGTAGMTSYLWSITGSGSISGSTTGQTVSARAANVCNGSFTLSLTIAKNGCSSTCTQSISVVDTTAPVIGQAGAGATISCPATPSFTPPTATDACDPNPSIVEVSDVTTPGSCIGSYLRTKTWKAVDACGNQSVLRTQTINVIDNTPPTIGTPGAGSTINCPAVPSFTPPTATDICDPHPSVIEISDVTTPGACAGAYTRTKTWKAVDACNNASGTVSQAITVIDNTPPVISQAGANATISCPAVPVFTAPTATDACDLNPSVILVSDSTTPGSCPGTYSRTKTWKALDACSNQSVLRSQTINVIDNTPPVIGAPGAGATINCPATPVFTPPTATDACDLTPTVIELSDVTTPGSCKGTYSRTKTWKAVDDCNNSSGTVSQTIVVIDNAAPVIGQPGANATISCPATPSFTPPTATDGCDLTPLIIEVTDTTIPGLCANNYSRTKKWKAVDECGNQSGLVSQTITVIDTVRPTITCPAPIVLGCNAAIPAPNPSAITATDNCSGTVTVQFVSDGVPSLNGACLETRIRTYKATDACGNTATCTQSISRTFDTIPPVLNCPGDVQVECNTSVAPAVTGTATATDNCSAQVTFHDVTTSQNCFTYITRTWTATDLCNNVSTCQQQILILDRTPPVFTCQPNVQLACGAAIPTPGVSDNCTPTPQIITTFNDSLVSGGCASSRNRRRIWTAIDASGNRSTCVQQISFNALLRPAAGSPVVTDEKTNSISEIQVAAYPNPFESNVTIEFNSQIASRISLQVFDANGSRVAELYNGNAEAGKLYKVYFNGAGHAPGIYFYKIISDSNSYMNKLILIK